MPLSINTNVASLTAQRAMYNSNSALETAFERLSTGKRINSSVDDAAGLAIGKGLESRVSGLNQAVRNVNDGISMVQIAEGSLDEVTTILQRMRDLAVQAATGSLSSVEKGYLDTEHSKLATALGKAIDQSQFNGTDLVNDSSATNITIQSGADKGDTTSLSFKAMSESSLLVSAAQIDLAGASTSPSSVGFDAFLGSNGAKETQKFVGMDAKLATGGTGSYTAVIDGVTYTTAVVQAPTTVAGLASALNSATSSTGVSLSAAGTFHGSMTQLDFTAASGGALDDIVLASSGFDTQVNSGSATTMTAVATGLGNTETANDTFRLTVGTKVFEAVDSGGANHETNKQIAAALQATLTAQGVTEFSIGTVGDQNNGVITLTYAGTTSDTSSTAYKLEKFKADGSAATGTAVTTGASVNTATNGASDAIATIDAALATVASERATLGAAQAELESTVRNLANVAENTSAAAGRIMDTDYAAETANLTKAQILQQAATSILAQANAQPQSVLSLLQ